MTVTKFVKKKCRGEKIVMVTAYDYTMAKIVDSAGVDGILVGDSLGMVLLGYNSTLPVRLSEMIHHVRAVARAKPRALLVADMPFMSYEPSRTRAVESAGKLIKAGAEAVKLEGGTEYVDRVEAIVKAGIPVMGHIGLTPQRYLKYGGYKLMGKNAEVALKLIEDALALQEAGAFAIVIEHTTSEVAAEITKRLKIPTICIGSGPYCDGQVVVLHDIIGLTENPPYFTKQYADVASIIRNAVRSFINDVISGRFPKEKHFKSMSKDEYEKFIELLRKRYGNTSPS